MRTPCKAICKNVGGICNGCKRTIQEIIDWQNYSEQQRQNVMEQLSGVQFTHLCPECGQPAYCGISAGEEKCWCFEVEQREIPSSLQGKACLCRSCLSKQPLR